MNTISLTLRKSLALQWLMLLALLPGLVLFPVPLKANPSGQQVVAGNVSFQGLGTSNLNINNLSQNAIINWQSFSIQQGEVTNINQAANAMTLNRVVSGNPTAIYGALQAAQGGVMVINPNGIVVHKGGTIDVAGMLTMSTLDITNDDFLDRGSNRFTGGGSAGIKNYGAITSDAGDVVLLGNFLQNAQGASVTANKGVVAFGAGGDMLVEQTVNGSTISVLGASEGGEIGIENSGQISASAAELKAHGNVYALAIKNDGVVRASGYNFSGGRLTLSGGSGSRVVNTGQLYARRSDGAGGQVSVSGGRVEIGGGTIDASGFGATSGGSVSVTGENVMVADGATIDVSGAQAGSITVAGQVSTTINGSLNASSAIGAGGNITATAPSLLIGSTASADVSGVTSGGSAKFGGGYQGGDASIVNAETVQVDEGSLIMADSQDGDAGSVIVWADRDTNFGGEISARAHSLGNGGFVEVSGRENLHFAGYVSTLSAGGANGTLLLDPTDIIIGQAGAASVTLVDTVLAAAVVSNNVIVHTSGNGGGNGDISVLSGSDVEYYSPNSLTFLAHGSIFIDGDIKNHGIDDTANTGNITLLAGWSGDSPTPVILTPDVPLAPGAGTGAAGGSYVSAAIIESGDYGTWGNGNGSVYLNPGGAEPVEVGSARGETNAYGYDIVLSGGTAGGRFAQLGYRRESDDRSVVNFGSAGTQTTSLNPSLIVDGNITARATHDLLLTPDSAANNQDGVKNVDRAYTMIGHGGLRAENNDVDNRGGTDYGSDSGNIGVGSGDNSGNITVSAGRVLGMMADRAESFTKIGHGGLGNAAPGGSGGNAGFGDTTTASALNNVIAGDLTGDISITAAVIEIEGGLYNQAFAQVGHGGLRARGNHTGDIRVESTTAGIKAEAAPESAVGGPTNGNDWRWRSNRDQSFVQVGHGGFDSSAAGILNNGTGSVGRGILGTRNLDGAVSGHHGDITVISALGVDFRAATGTDAYAMVGHGGRSSSGDHVGDITVESRLGDITFDRDADQLNAVGRDIKERGTRAFVQVGHGGALYEGGSSGTITVNSAGSVEFYAGREQSHAMIGHGGRADATGASNQRGNGHAAGTHSGAITVTAANDVKFRSGFSRAADFAFSQIGHGGFYQIADDGFVDGSSTVSSTEVTGHNGAISVTSGGSISFRAGADDLREGQRYLEENGNNNHTMIGHGGWRSFGDHYGTIDVNATGGDVEVAAAGGWRAINVQGTNFSGTPAISRGDDGASTGSNNFAQIGHGGRDSEHRVDQSGRTLLDSGTEGVGFGVLGDSTITVTATGDVRVSAAQTTDVGAKIPERIYQVNWRDQDNNGAVINLSAGGIIDPVRYATADGTLVLPGQGFSSVGDFDQTQSIQSSVGGGVLGNGTVVNGEGNTRTIFNRTNTGYDRYIERSNDGTGEIWRIDDNGVVVFADGSFGQIGHGGYNSLGNAIRADGEGHRGEVNVDAGGTVSVLASDIDPGVIDTDFLTLTVLDAFYAPTGAAAIEVGPGKSGPNIGANAGNQDNTQVNRRNYAQIGLGGAVTRGDHLGNVTVIANGNINVFGGNNQHSYAQIGTGGYETDLGGATIGQSGDIQVISRGGSVTLQAGGIAARSTSNTTNTEGMEAFIGNGGWATDGTHTGDIRVSAGADVQLNGGAGAREAFAQIGNGGYSTDGDHSGSIDVEAGGDVNLRRGVGLINAWSKIGHGGQASGARPDNGTGSIDGNITVSVGDDFSSEGGLVGHADPETIPIFGSGTGDTYIAVGRNNNLTTGTGQFIADSDSSFSSGGYGASSELRLYIPNPTGNVIEDGAYFNDSNYVNTPAPGSSPRTDEQLAADHTLFLDADGAVTGDFGPDGTYAANSFGFYTIFYSDLGPPLPFVPPGGIPTDAGSGLPPVFLDFDFANLFFPDSEFFESFERGQEGLTYSDYDGLLYGLGYGDAIYDDGATDEEYVSGFFLEELLDANFGPRQNPWSDRDNGVIAEENDEERRRRKSRAAKPGGPGGMTIFVFDPSTSRYSSLRIFGVDATKVGILQ